MMDRRLRLLEARPPRGQAVGEIRMCCGQVGQDRQLAFGEWRGGLRPAGPRETHPLLRAGTDEEVEHVGREGSEAVCSVQTTASVWESHSCPTAGAEGRRLRHRTGQREYLLSSLHCACCSSCRVLC
jgi:hypothetical protein